MLEHSLTGIVNPLPHQAFAPNAVLQKYWYYQERQELTQKFLVLPRTVEPTQDRLSPPLVIQVGENRRQASFSRKNLLYAKA
jgi:hypothetical protein